jgi:hypothetical protein
MRNRLELGGCTLMDGHIVIFLKKTLLPCRFSVLSFDWSLER